MIEQLSGLPPAVVGVRATAEVSAEDYEAVLMPAVEAAIHDHGKVRLLYQVGPGFTGFTLGALWDDARVGLGHLSAWEKLALVTDVAWIRHAAGLFRFAMPCPLRIFALEEFDAALRWIAE